MGVTYELLMLDGKTFLRHRNHFILYSPRQILPLPHIQLYKEQNQVTIHDSDTSDMLQSKLYNSYDNCKLYDLVRDGDPLFNEFDDRIMFQNE